MTLTWTLVWQMGTPSHSARLEKIQPMGIKPQRSRHLSMVSELKKYVKMNTRTLFGAPGCAANTLLLSVRVMVGFFFLSL